MTDRLGVADTETLIEDQGVKDRLRANTEAAVELGLFGVPTAIVDDELFWGQDSTSMLFAYLKDPELFRDDEMVRAANLPTGI